MSQLDQRLDEVLHSKVNLRHKLDLLSVYTSHINEEEHNRRRETLITEKMDSDTRRRLAFQAMEMPYRKAEEELLRYLIDTHSTVTTLLKLNIPGWQHDVKMQSIDQKVIEEEERLLQQSVVRPCASAPSIHLQTEFLDDATNSFIKEMRSEYLEVFEFLEEALCSEDREKSAANFARQMELFGVASLPFAREEYEKVEDKLKQYTQRRIIAALGKQKSIAASLEEIPNL